MNYSEATEDPSDGMPLDDVLFAIYRWADYRGIGDKDRIYEAIDVGRRSFSGTAEIEVAIEEAQAYLDSYLD